MNEQILRWNFEEYHGRVQVCKGEHDKALGCQFEPLTLADTGMMRGRIVELQQTVTEKTDKVNALWIENQTLLKQLNEAQRQNELFRWLVDAWTFSDTPPSESDLKRMADAYAKIIEGGALK